MEEAMSSFHHDQQSRFSQQQTSEDKLSAGHTGQQYYPKKIQQHQQLKHSLAQRQHQVTKSTQDVQHVKRQSQSMQLQTFQMQDQQLLKEAESLQLKLKTESNKIIEWQVKKEIECSELQKKLKESEDLAERQRKNLLDLQMNCERVSQEFQEELKNREELESKVVYTRHICTILQDHYQQLDVTLKSFVETRDNLTDRNKDIMDQFSKFTETFESAYNAYEVETDNLKDLLSTERENRVNDINEANRIHHVLEQKLEETAIKLCAEQQKCQNFEEEVANSNFRIQELAKAKSSITQELEKKYATLEKDYNTVITEKKHLTSNLQNITVDFSKLNDTHKMLLAENKLTEEKLEASLSVIDNLEIVLKEHTALMNQTSTEKEGIVTELENLKEGCQQMKHKFNEEIKLNQKLNEEIGELKSCCNKKCEELKAQQAKYESDTLGMNTILTQEKYLRSSIESELQENKQCIIDLTNQLMESSTKAKELENQVDELKNVSTNREIELENLTVCVKELKEENQNIQQLLLSCEASLEKSMDKLSEINSIKEELEIKIKDSEDSFSKLNEENNMKLKILSEKDTVMTKTIDELNKVKSEKEYLVIDMKKLEEQIIKIKAESSQKLKETMMCIEEYKQTYVSQLTDHEEVKKKLKEKLECITKELKEVFVEKENTTENLAEQEIKVGKLENYIKTLETKVKKLGENLEKERQKTMCTKEKQSSPLKVTPSPVKLTYQCNPKKQVHFEEWSDTTDESSIDVSMHNIQTQAMKRAAMKHTSSQPNTTTAKKGRSANTLSQSVDKSNNTSAMCNQPKNSARKFFKKAGVPHPRTLVDDDIFHF